MFPSQIKKPLPTGKGYIFVAAGALHTAPVAERNTPKRAFEELRHEFC